MRLGKLIINALALVAAGFIVPNFDLRYQASIKGLVFIALLAIVFAVINTFLKPLVKLVTLPVTWITLGLFGFVVNAVMLLVTAAVVGALQSDPYVFQLGGWPPNFSLDTIIAALLGAFVVSLVSTVLAYFMPDR